MESAVIGAAKETVGLVSCSAETSIDSTCSPPPAESQARVTLELHPVMVRETIRAVRASVVFCKRIFFRELWA
jgi:hypothetical protein